MMVVADQVGRLLAHHPVLSLLISIALVLALSIGNLWARLEKDIRVSFSPPDSVFQREFNAYMEFYQLDAYPQRAFILFTPNPDSNRSLLEEQNLRQVLRIDDEMMRTLRKKDAQGREACSPLCRLNEPFHLLVRELQAASRGNGTGLETAYPKFNVHGFNLSLEMHLFGVTTSDVPSKRNNSRIVNVQSIMLWYFSRAATDTQKKDLKETSLRLFVDSEQEQRSVHYSIFSDPLSNHEMLRGAAEATRLMSIGFVFLVLFVCWVVRRRAADSLTPLGFWSVVWATVLTPICAALSAFGTLSWLQQPIYTLSCITPFLVLGIGVDDSFIILAHWRHLRRARSGRETTPLLLRAVGPSVAVTSVTNVIAFAIGYFTPTPQMSSFCLCTSISLLYDWILTYTIFVPIVQLVSDLTARRPGPAASPPPPPGLPLPPCLCAQSRMPVKWNDDDDDGGEEEEEAQSVDKKMSVQTMLTAVTTLRSDDPRRSKSEKQTSGSSQPPSFSSEATFHHHNHHHHYQPPHHSSTLWDRYSRWLCTWKARLLCVFFLVSLYSFAAIGVMDMRASFRPNKAFPSDSRLTQSLIDITPIFNQYFPVNVYVNQPPDLNNSTEVHDFLQLVDRLEHVSGSLDADHTLLFLRPYALFDESVWNWTHHVLLMEPPPHQLGAGNLASFLDMVGRPANIQLESGNKTRIRRFGFTMFARSMAEWANRARYIQDVRAILHSDSESKWNASLLDPDAAILDLLLTVRRDLLVSILITVACMMAVCAFAIPSKLGCLSVTFCISSICGALVGCLGWSGADFDPVTMVDVLIATGFSVDFTAHIACYYFTAKGSVHQRLAVVLGQLSAPMLEAGSSTTLCMLPLIFVRTYSIVAFAKTIFFVVALGLLHGLFVLPILLSMCPLSAGEDEPPPSTPSKCSLRAGDSCEEVKTPLSVGDESTVAVAASS